MEEEIKQKPFYPIAPNHYFKNQSYRSSILSARKRQLNNWGLRSTKNLFINGTAGAIRLNDSGNCGNEVKFSLGACGYPIEKSVHDKIFDGMTHQGYYNPTLSEKIMVVLRDVPFVPFEITDGKKCFKDLCVVEGMFGGSTLPCDWIEFTDDYSGAYLKGTEAGELVGRWTFKDKNLQSM